MSNYPRAVAVSCDTNIALPEPVREPVVQSIRTTKIRPQHRERVAIVYVRQATPQQVIDHQESGLRQYDLAAHAMSLGWSQQRVLAIDGKTLRHSFDRAAGKSALHLVSAWAVENGVSLGQRAVDGKSNEITAMPELLKLLELHGAIVTIDAMGCQKEIAQAIRRQGGDYLLAVKDNQPRLYEDLLATFVDAFEGQRGTDYYQHTTHKQSHGRDERREYYVVRDVSQIRDRALWTDLRSLAMVYTERTVNGATSSETRYYISSCPGAVKDMARAIRGHRGIENSLHWTLDVTFGEDAHCLRKDHGPENMATRRRAALSLINQEQTEKGSLRRKRLRAGWNDAHLERLLTCVK